MKADVIIHLCGGGGFWVGPGGGGGFWVGPGGGPRGLVGIKVGDAVGLKVVEDFTRVGELVRAATGSVGDEEGTGVADNGAEVGAPKIAVLGKVIPGAA